MKVAVVQGGPSSEAEVSRASAAGVAGALRQGGEEVTLLELDARVAEALREGDFDVVFPAVHGEVGEDGSLQGLLEVLGLPYVGSGVLASALAMDKAMARRVLAAEGLPVARGLALARGGDALEAAGRVRAALGARVVVKPSRSGSAIGVARLDGASDVEVARALEEAWALDEVAVVEHFAAGREVTCSVLDVNGEGARALAATEIASPNDAFYTYEARYAPGRSVHTCPAVLGSAMERRVHAAAVAAHRTLGCRDLSRADFVVGDREDPDALVLLEVNTMPGMTPTSLYPEAARAAGLDFVALCAELVRSARARGAARRNAPRAFPA